MKIFLTGASGFVGANMAHRLVKEGHEVHVCLRSIKNMWRISDLKGQINIHLVDLTDFSALSKVLSEVRPDAIIHMATYGAYPTLQTEMQKIFDTNFTGLINLVRAAGQVRYECLINTSSSSEYGLIQTHMNEKDLPAPINYYGAAKTAGTVFCQTHTRITGAPIITTRLFSVYGPYEEPIRLVPSTIRKCLLNEKLEFTSGTQKRDFIYTSDIEDAYLSLLKRPDLKGEILNIGTGTQYSVREIVNEIVDETKPHSAPVWGAMPTRNFESENWVADMSKTKKLLNWEAKISLKEGIKRDVSWMRNNLHLYSGDQSEK